MKARLIVALFILFITSVFAYDTTYSIPPWEHTWGIHRVTSKDLQIRFADTSFKSPQGLSVTRLKATDDTNTSKDNIFVTVYGVDAGLGTIIYNTSMFSLGRYGTKGSGKGELLYPHGIHGNDLGEVFVCDSGNARVVHLSNSSLGTKSLSKDQENVMKGYAKARVSAPLFAIISQIVKGLQEEETLNEVGYIGSDWQYPYDVSQDSDGRLYITDYKANVIKIFTSKGKKIKSIKVNAPTAIVVRDEKEQAHAYNLKRRFYSRNPNWPLSYIAVITDSGKRIALYTLDGKLIRSKTAEEMGIKNAKLRYIESDIYLNLIATDSQNNCIHKITPELKVLSSFGEYGEGDNQFIAPTGIAVHRKYGMIFIAENDGAQYYVIGTDIKNVRTETDNSGFNILWDQTEPSEVKITIYTKRGRGRKIVERLAPRISTYSLEPKIEFKFSYLKRRKIKLVKGQKYYLEIEANPSYSAKQHVKSIAGTYFIWEGGK